MALRPNLGKGAILSAPERLTAAAPILFALLIRSPRSWGELYLAGFSPESLPRVVVKVVLTTGRRMEIAPEGMRLALRSKPRLVA